MSFIGDPVQANVPASKSILLRLMMLATYRQRPLQIIGRNDATDVLTMSQSLRDAGLATMEIQPDGYRVAPCSDPAIRRKEPVPLRIVDSAAALRFLIARVAVTPGLSCRIDVSDQLRRRPVMPLVDALNNSSAMIEVHSHHQAFPLLIHGNSLATLEIHIPGNRTSQYTSAVLLCAPSFMDGLTLLTGEEHVSSSYIDMTIRLLARFGVRIEARENRFIIPPGTRMEGPDTFRVEPDYSAAAYFWVLGALSKRGVTVLVPGSDLLQGDAVFPLLLGKMGARVERTNERITVAGGNLRGEDFDLRSTPDLVPPLAIVAMYASGRTVLSGIAHLRDKESDRIEGLASGLRKLGARVETGEDWMRIHPVRQHPKKVSLDSLGDHRLAMAFGLLRYLGVDVSIDGEESVRKSFPGFWDEFSRVCGLLGKGTR